MADLKFKTSDVLINGIATSNLEVRKVKQMIMSELILHKQAYAIDSTIIFIKPFRDTLREYKELLKEKAIIPILRNNVNTFVELQELGHKENINDNPLKFHEDDYGQFLDDLVGKPIKGEPLGETFTNSMFEIAKKEEQSSELGLGKALWSILNNAKRKGDGTLGATPIVNAMSSLTDSQQEKIWRIIQTVYYLTPMESLSNKHGFIHGDFTPDNYRIVDKTCREKLAFDLPVAHYGKEYTLQRKIGTPIFGEYYLADNIDWHFIKDYIRPSDESKQYFESIENDTEITDRIRALLDYFEFIDSKIREKHLGILEDYKQIETLKIKLIMKRAAYQAVKIGVPMAATHSLSPQDILENVAEVGEFAYPFIASFVNKKSLEEELKQMREDKWKNDYRIQEIERRKIIPGINDYVLPFQ